MGFLRTNFASSRGQTITLRQRNIHDKIGGKSKEEETIDAKASYSGRPE
jgi:hypothetical protein